MPYKVVQLFDSPDSTLPDYGDMIRQAGIDVDHELVRGAAFCQANLGDLGCIPQGRECGVFQICKT